MKLINASILFSPTLGDDLAHVPQGHGFPGGFLLLLRVFVGTEGGGGSTVAAGHIQTPVAFGLDIGAVLMANPAGKKL